MSDEGADRRGFGGELAFCATSGLGGDFGDDVTLRIGLSRIVVSLLLPTELTCMNSSSLSGLGSPGESQDGSVVAYPLSDISNGVSGLKADISWWPRSGVEGTGG